MELARYMISDAAKKIDVEPHVLRYWEEELAVDIPRNEMGHRYYSEDEIRMMRGVKFLKEKGFQLKSIKILLPDIKKVMGLEQRRLLELRDRLELAVSQEELRLQREEELKQCERVSKEGKNSSAESLGEELQEKMPPINQGKEESLQKKEKSEIEQEMPPAAQEKEDVEETMLLATQKAGMAREYTEKGEAAPGDGRMQQFRKIMNDIILDAMSENNRQLTENITESVSRELEYQMKKREMQEEEHFKQLDRTLREYQQGQKQIAVAKEYPQKGRRQSKFFKKNKVRI